jgi:hypothetical protein
MTETPSRRNPGRPALITRTLLLDAGAHALRDRATGPTLAAAYDLRIPDILTAAATLLRENGTPTRRNAIAPTALYRHWPDGIDAYLTDLTGHLFPADGLPVDHLTDDTLDLDLAIEQHVTTDKKQINRHDFPTYLAVSAAAAHDPAARAALTAVYTAYDANVIPALTDALERADRYPNPNLGINPHQAIAAALTALTEGLTLRNITQPEIASNTALWVLAAQSLVNGLTLKTTDAVTLNTVTAVAHADIDLALRHWTALTRDDQPTLYRLYTTEILTRDDLTPDDLLTHLTDAWITPNLTNPTPYLDTLPLILSDRRTTTSTVLNLLDTLITRTHDHPAFSPKLVSDTALIAALTASPATPKPALLDYLATTGKTVTHTGPLTAAHKRTSSNRHHKTGPTGTAAAIVDTLRFANQRPITVAVLNGLVTRPDLTTRDTDVLLAFLNRAASTTVTITNDITAMRHALASNPELPPTTGNALLNSDEPPAILTAVLTTGRHTATALTTPDPKNIVTYLLSIPRDYIDHSLYTVFEALAASPHVPHPFWGTLYTPNTNDPLERHLYPVFTANPAIPAPVRARALLDSVMDLPDVSRALANLTADDITTITDPVLLIAIAQHVPVTADVLTTLAKDPDPTVRAAATERLLNATVT